MLVDDTSTSGIVEIPASPIHEVLDAELDEYNVERPMAPYSEEACKAMWAGESMGPSSFDDIIDNYKHKVYHENTLLSCTSIPQPESPIIDETILFSHPETTVSWSDWEEIEDEDFVQLVTWNDVLCPERSTILELIWLLPFYGSRRTYPPKRDEL